jgi:hypothetical protein
MAGRHVLTPDEIRPELGIGGERQRREESAWETLEGARALLIGDLTVLEQHVNSKAPGRFDGIARSVHSQNGEDGIIEHLTSLLGISEGTFVEIGAADGEENCTRLLAEHGWSGIWFEADGALAARAARLSFPGEVRVVEAMVEPDNVLELLRGAEVPEDLDLLSVDIDGNDYWVLRAVLEGGHRPRLVIAEYSGDHRWEWVSAYRRGRSWDRSWDFGASLPAQRRMLESFGYTLVGCDPVGVNAFYVRSDLASTPGVGPDRSELYVAPSHRPATLGHPRSSPLADPERIGRSTAGDLALVDLTDAELVRPAERHPGERAYIVVNVHNGTPHLLASDGPEPVYLSYRMIRLDGPTGPLGEPLRSPLASVVEPGSTRPSAVEVPLPDTTGEHLIIPTVVQEFVAWRTAKPHEGIIVSIVDPPA